MYATDPPRRHGALLALLLVLALVLTLGAAGEALREGVRAMARVRRTRRDGLVPRDPFDRFEVPLDRSQCSGPDISRVLGDGGPGD